MKSAHDQSITSHPKYSSFLKLGSPRNFLSRDFLRRPQIDITTHYTISQTSFAHQSMDSLISITEKFEPERIFNLDQESISAEEIENVEKLYQQITEERMSCRIKSSESYEKKSSIEAAATLGNAEDYLKNGGRIVEYVKLMNEKTILNGLTYHPSLSIAQSHTILSRNNNYVKYFDLEDAEYHLPLSHFTKLLGNEIPDLDRDILVGKLTSNPRDVIHEMGLYRTEINNPDRETKIARVDEVTALALKKVFTAENEDEALKFAFIFGALRGYNIRSTTGACWAQEMSMRWIFAKKDWPQFNKMPGVYLDIEASILPEGEQSFTSLIDRQIRDYKASISAEEAIGEDSLFDRPVTQEKDEFIRYLIETKSYREEDLLEIISYQTNDSKKPTSLDLIASLGDKKFFEILRKKIEEEPEIRDAITRQGVKWGSVIDNAVSYGDEAITNIIEELRCLAPQTVFKAAASAPLAEPKTNQKTVT